MVYLLLIKRKKREKEKDEREREREMARGLFSQGRYVVLVGCAMSELFQMLVQLKSVSKVSP
jgi:hypothetical protein